MHVMAEARPILLQALKADEGLRLRPYLCSAGVPTIGIGATTYPDGRKVRLDDPPITEAQAMRMLAIEADRYMLAVLRMCSRYPTAHQLAALVRLGYNIGLTALQRSTVMRLHNAGDIQGSARAFGLWNKARVNGALTVLPGLTARRAREAAMYLTPAPEQAQDPVPQAVAPESSLVASPIAQGGAAATVGASALALVPALEPETVGKWRDALGLDPQIILALLIVAACGYVIWWRWQQRRQGWA